MWEAHLSAVLKSCLISFCILAQKISTCRWGNLECFLFGHVATLILRRNHGNVSIELLLDAFICLQFLSVHVLDACYVCKLNLYANSSAQCCVAFKYYFRASVEDLYLTSVDANLVCRVSLSEVQSHISNLCKFDCIRITKCLPTKLESETCNLALFPGLPHFCSLVCIQIIHGSRRVPKKVYKFVCNERQSEFLTGEVEYCRSCERLGFWLLLECLMMKSSTLFEFWPLSPCIHLVSTRYHSRDRCSQAFPVFHHSSASMYYLKVN